MDLIIKNGNIVFPDSTIQTSIGVDDGEIVAIGSSACMPKSERVIDAKGNYVLPGGIDSRVLYHIDHANSPIPAGKDSNPPVSWYP